MKQHSELISRPLSWIILWFLFQWTTNLIVYAAWNRHTIWHTAYKLNFSWSVDDCHLPVIHFWSKMFAKTCDLLSFYYVVSLYNLFLEFTNSNAKVFDQSNQGNHAAWSMKDNHCMCKFDNPCSALLCKWNTASKKISLVWAHIRKTPTWLIGKNSFFHNTITFFW